MRLSRLRYALLATGTDEVGRQVTTLPFVRDDLELPSSWLSTFEPGWFSSNGTFHYYSSTFAGVGLLMLVRLTLSNMNSDPSPALVQVRYTLSTSRASF
jgi:hypothetical protein